MLRGARAWLRRAKAEGRVRVLGGGWWRIEGIGRAMRPIQGYGALAKVLRARGLMDANGQLVDSPANRGCRTT